MLFGTNVNVDFWCNVISQPDQGKGLNNWMLNTRVHHMKAFQHLKQRFILSFLIKVILAQGKLNIIKKI